MHPSVHVRRGHTTLRHQAVHLTPPPPRDRQRCRSRYSVCVVFLGGEGEGEKGRQRDRASHLLQRGTVGQHPVFSYVDRRVPQPASEGPVLTLIICTNNRPHAPQRSIRMTSTGLAPSTQRRPRNGRLSHHSSSSSSPSFAGGASEQVVSLLSRPRSLSTSPEPPTCTAQRLALLRADDTYAYIL